MQAPAKTKAMSEAKNVPDLSNATPTFLLDEIGRIRVESNRLKFLEGVFKDALRSRISTQQLEGVEPIVGDQFVGYYESMVQRRIDTDRVREHFKNDPATLNTLMKTIEYPQLNVKPKEGQPKTSKPKSKPLS